MNKIFTIFLLFTGLNFTSFAQNKPVTADPGVKIVKFFPNPATTVVNFELQRGYDRLYSLQVTSFMGKKLYEQKNITQRIVLPLNNFYRGLYFYQLIDRTGRIIESGRFQVVK